MGYLYWSLYNYVSLVGYTAGVDIPKLSVIERPFSKHTNDVTKERYCGINDRRFPSIHLDAHATGKVEA
jgi:hypothetical protein